MNTDTIIIKKYIELISCVSNIKIFLHSYNFIMNEVNKLLIALNEKTEFQKDIWTYEHQFSSGNKKWVAGIVPYELLKRNLNEAISSLMTLSEDGIFYNTFPDDIKTPKYEDNWGVSAN